MTTASGESDPFAAAIARSARVQQELIVMADAMLTETEVADRLAVTPQALDRLREGNDLLAVQRDSAWLYPAFQFESAVVCAGIKQVLNAYNGHDPWSVMDILLACDDTLGDRSLLDAIRDGDHDAVDRYIQQDLNDGYS